MNLREKNGSGQYPSWLSLLLLLSLVGIGWPVSAQSKDWRLQAGQISFTSDAPLELIQARSEQIQGLIKSDGGSFAFAVEISSFQGFNSSLQREHFNENYLESHRFPRATFSGRIIEPIDMSKDGTFSIRAKGRLNIHGVEQERIIKSTIIISEGKVRLESYFTVPLQEHDIRIPHLVYQKIAEEIRVEIKARFE